MKKIFMASLVAMMAVTTANAQIASTEYTDATFVAKDGFDDLVGGTTQVTANKSAIATINGRVGNISKENMGTKAGTVVEAIKEVVTEKADKATTYTKDEADAEFMTSAEVTDAITSATSADSAQVAANKTDIATINTGLGTVTAGNMGTTATTVVGAIKEVVDEKQIKSGADYQMGNKDGGWTTMSDAQQKALNSGVTSGAVNMVATNSNNIGAIAQSAFIKSLEVKTLTGAVNALADVKQFKSTADYQMGNSKGGWTAMTDAQQSALNSGVTTATVGQVATNKTGIETINTGLGTVTAGNMGTTATTVVGAIKEVVTNKADKATTYTKDEADAEFMDAGEVASAITNATSADSAQVAANKTSIEQLQTSKQIKSTADYQMGNKDGGWTPMTDAQQKALNSGITSATVGLVGTNASNIGAIAQSAFIKSLDDQSLTGAVNALNTAKQVKSTADYQMGNKDGQWTTMTAAQKNALNSGITADIVAKANSAMQETGLKALESWGTQKCATQGVTCSLVSKSGTIAWEAVKY